MNRNVIIILILMLLSFSVTGELFRIYVDREFGFWAVRSDNISHILNFTDKTLNIRTGDTVIWENGDGEGDRVTVISNNRLWNDTGVILGRVNDQYRFTFNSSGTFRFYVKESSRTSFNISNQTNTLTKFYDEDTERWYYQKAKGKVIDIDRYPYQSMTLKVTGDTIGLGTHPIGYYQQKNVINISNYSNVVPTQTPFKINMKERGTMVSPTLNMTENFMPLESYQEFTLYEVLKRWYLILVG